MKYELEAYGWQRIVDKTFRATDGDIIDALKKHPAYRPRS
jgi:hypothetical protein